MATKSEYRAYIQSEAWQKRRKEFLALRGHCNRCLLPRWAAIIAYDQDLNVHHRNYQSVGHELGEDLEPLCRRCHEIDAMGRSALVDASTLVHGDRRFNDWIQSHSEEWMEGFNEGWEWLDYLESIIARRRVA